MTSVTQKLDKILELRQPISVLVKFADMCAEKSNKKCTVLASAKPVLSIPLKLPDFAGNPGRAGVALTPRAFPQNQLGVFQVPLPLAKQTTLDAQEMRRWGSPGSDILVTINYKRPFWMLDSANYTRQYDLEATLMHEMLHGLGLGSSTFEDQVRWENGESEGPVDVMLPRSYKRASPLPPTVWDSLIVLVPTMESKFHYSHRQRQLRGEPSSEPLPWLDGLQEYSPMRECTSAGEASSVYKSTTEPCTRLWKQSQERYQMLTTQFTLVFAPGPLVVSALTSWFDEMAGPVWKFNLTADGTKQWIGIPLETSVTPYSIGATLSHWDKVWAEQPGSPEGLFSKSSYSMNSTKVPLSLDTTLVKSTYQQSGFGPAVIAALYALGYKIKGLPDLGPLNAETVDLTTLGMGSPYQQIMGIPVPNEIGIPVGILAILAFVLMVIRDDFEPEVVEPPRKELAEPHQKGSPLDSESLISFTTEF
jgi:hypothetical protein